MPIQRREAVVVSEAPPSGRFRERVRITNPYAGYVYGAPGGDSWTEGYIKIGIRKFNIVTKFVPLSGGDEAIEIEFNVEDNWLTADANRFFRTGGKTWAGYLTYPDWLRAEVDYPGNTYTFTYRGTAWGGHRPVAFAIRERARRN